MSKNCGFLDFSKHVSCMGDRKISICKSGEYPAFVELLYEMLQ